MPLLTVASFNILAQNKIKRAQFPYCAQDTLRWKHRRDLLGRVIRELDADVLCLQEVDQWTHYFEAFLSEDCRYDGRYEMRHRDGLWIGWRRDRFACLDYSIVDLAPTMAELVAGGAVPNIAQVARLRSSLGAESAADLTVINTHLYWAPGFDELRERQAESIVEQAARPAMEVGTPIIICGDLNSDPESAALKVLRAAGFRPSLAPDIPFTVFSEFREIVDHILVWPSEVSVECATSFDIEMMTRETALPNMDHPSDHIPVRAFIKF